MKKDLTIAHQKCKGGKMYTTYIDGSMTVTDRNGKVTVIRKGK